MISGAARGWGAALPRKQMEEKLSLALIFLRLLCGLLTGLAVGLEGSVFPAPQRRSPQVATATEVTAERDWVPRYPHSHTGIKQTKNKESLAWGQGRASRLDVSGWSSAYSSGNWAIFASPIGLQGFEPWTSWTPSRRSTKLSHSPFCWSSNDGPKSLEHLPPLVMRFVGPTRQSQIMRRWFASSRREGKSKMRQSRPRTHRVRGNANHQVFATVQAPAPRVPPTSLRRRPCPCRCG